MLHTKAARDPYSQIRAQLVNLVTKTIHRDVSPYVTGSIPVVIMFEQDGKAAVKMPDFEDSSLTVLTHCRCQLSCHS